MTQLYFMQQECKSYSQNKEQEIIASYFDTYYPGSTGMLLSFGENDGTTLSNCRDLLEKGWSGVLVEPSPSAFAKLKELYKGNPNVEVFECAASDTRGTATLYDSGEHLGKGDTALLSTLNKSERERWHKEKFKEIIVPVVDAEIFNRFGAGFISIDAEGEDIKILKRLDLNYCRLLCIEWNSLPENKKQIDEILLPKGFKLIHKNAENLIYGVHDVQ